MRSAHTGILLSLALMWAVPGYSREKEEVLPPPPMAKTGTTTAFLDQPVEITLHLAGRIAEPLSFLIRKNPRSGKLSGLRRITRNSAVIIYTPDPKVRPGDDFFSFAAQSVDSAVSAPATIWIRLIERPAVLEHPLELDFGTVFLGDEEERLLTIKNSGGGVALGTLSPNPPWRTGKSPEFRVPAGTESSLPILFAPEEERDFSDRIPIGQDPQAFVTLRGTGMAPVTWPKEGVVVSPEEREKGTTTITFANHSSVERVVTINWPDFLKAPKEILLPPDAASPLRVDVQAPPSLNVEQEVEVRSGNFSAHLPVRIFPAPARLSVTPERELKLGIKENGRMLHGRFLVRNTGGAKTTLEILAPPGIQILPDPSNILLAGGSEQAFEILAEKSPSHLSEGILRLQSPGGKPVEISLKLPASAENRAAVPVEDFLRLPTDPQPSPVSPPSGKVPAVESARLVSAKTHEVEIRWDVPSPEISGFRVERRKLSPGREGRVVIDWLPWPEAKITRTDGTAAARFGNLPAGSFWTIRIVSLDENDAPAAVSPAFQIATRTAWKFRLPLWAWMLLLPGVLGGIALLLWKKIRHALHAREDERISRLQNP